MKSGLGVRGSETRKRRWARPQVFFPAVICLVCVVAVTILSFARFAIVEGVDSRIYDLNYGSSRPGTVHPGIALVLIDEKSLDVQGRWPWTRSRMARLNDILSKGGARVVGFDVGFLEAETTADSAFARAVGHRLEALAVRDPALDDLVSEHLIQTDPDRVFADSLGRSSAHSVLGYFFHMAGSDPNSLETGTDTDDPLDGIRSSRYPLVRFTSPESDSGWFFEALAPEGNLAVLSAATPHSGYFNLTADSDGVVRWIPLVLKCRDYYFPPLSLVCAWLFLNRPPLEVHVSDLGVSHIAMGDTAIPTDEHGQLLINFPGPAGTFPGYSATDVLTGAVPPETFDGKLVLVGATAKGLYDTSTTPFGPDHPGVEIHAAIINTLLTRQFITKSQWSLVYDLAAVVLIGILLGVALPRLRAVTGLLFSGALFMAQILGARLVFQGMGVWVNTVYPLLAIAITYTAVTVYRYFTEIREREKVKQMFSRYASAELIEEITREPEKLKLGGEVRTITVLFCDLANFTTISETRSPNDVVTIMSRYFKAMTEHVFHHRGTLKEYVGDELMALFGAPLHQEDHAVNACRTALAMQEFLEFSRNHPGKTGLPPLNARVGINSGEMLVGNLGSEYRFSYGALGDNVNLASRLEGLNKIYGTRIIIGEKTEALVRNDFFLRKLGAVRVKGRVQPENVFELIAGARDPIPDDRRIALECYEQGYRYYLEQRWTQAVAEFDKGRAAWPHDLSCDVMIQRCGMFERMPPGDDWDGVFMERRK